MTRRILLSDSFNTVSLIALVLLQTDVLVHPGMAYMCFFEDSPSACNWSFYPNPSSVISTPHLPIAELSKSLGDYCLPIFWIQLCLVVELFIPRAFIGGDPT